MKHLRGARFTVVVLALGLSLPLLAGPIEDAKAAYDSGDYATALRLWNDLAQQQGDASAQTRLGLMYRDGRGVTENQAEAVRWFRKAAEQGDALGQGNLGFMYITGRGVPPDDQQALEWSRKAAEQGDALGQANLGFMYESGRGGLPKDDRRAVEWYRKAAGQDNAFGQNNLGLMYQSGRGGLPQDDKQAVEWYRKAAEQGNAAGQANLGAMYQNGRGVAKDEAQAAQWFRKAAEQGLAGAQSNLGFMYETGRGVAKDETQAVQWYRKAAEQGDAFAQGNLGVMYRDGRGVAQDDAAAIAWFRKAAEQGDARAQAGLGFMYEQGRGVAGDYREALQWYRKAAEQGNTTAQTNLGFMYRDGRGVSQDQAEAEQWFRKAAEQGDTKAQTVLSSIERERRDLADLSRTIADLVKRYEAAQPAVPIRDAERAGLAREIIEASKLREKLSYLPESFNETETANAKVLPKLRDAIRVTALASFRPDRILASFDRRLAETLDATTLQAGLQWERSDLGRHINRLELEARKPEQRAAKNEFTRQFTVKGATANDARVRACAQKVILDNSADSALPLVEALFAAGLMVASVQQAQTLDIDAIGRLVVSLRPMLRDTARQSMLIECLFDLRELSDAEFDQLLEFLHTDLGGRYAMGVVAAQRDTFLEVTEVFTRTLLDVARQLKVRVES